MKINLLILKKNILLKSLTLIVLNEDKFIDCKEKHPWNMSPIFSTLVVLNEDKLIDCKEKHPENIPYISLTLVVLNEDKFIDTKDLHSANIHRTYIPYY